MSVQTVSLSEQQEKHRRQAAAGVPDREVHVGRTERSVAPAVHRDQRPVQPDAERRVGMTAVSCGTMTLTTKAPPRRVNVRGHGPRSYPLDVLQGTCECGCGAAVSSGKRFRPGHWARVQPKRDFGAAPLCECGCGRAVERRPGKWLKYATGHYVRARKPLHEPFTESDPFWSWFAGFTDGEGCFGIVLSTVGGKVYPQPYFKIALRADERAILEEIRDRLGCGRVRVHVPGSSSSNLQLKFEAHAIADCLRLVEVFERYPLRAKKRRDFAIWAEAVREKAANGTNPRLLELRERLIATRKYSEVVA